MRDDLFAYHGDLHAALQRTPKLASKPTTNGRVATVQIVGVISRDGLAGTSSDATAREINALAADASISAIELYVNSPGGAVNGTLELANSIAVAAKVKPVYAFAEDLCASGAFWVASQATKLYSNQTAQVGSLGTYGVLVDSSGMAAKIGVRVHVIKAGQHKGTGTPGTAITDEMLIEKQRVVDAINEHFLVAVAAGRKMPLARVRELADGRVHVGIEAAKLGLTDGVLSYDSFSAQVRAAFSQSQSKGSSSAMFTQEKRKGPRSEAFWSEVEARIQQGQTREKAIEATVFAEPELHKAMLAEANPNAYR